MNTYFSYFNRVIAYSLCWLMSVQPAMATVQPGNANTQVKQAGNGVPIINIATPNSKGLSHNQYQQFNVDKQGLILNNATNKFTQTQLGGIIQNNPNLHGKGASVILNEVTGANRSQLNGYTEVAGNKANVIVTNPYGITCNGCGFINTSRVSLSTGSPQIHNGEVSGFDVNQGDIIIDGQGLDATKQDYLDLISRSAKIQANIHANQLNIIAGPNEVDYKTNRIRSTKKATQSVPKVAIDSSALGGMYAGRIALVSTEQGVGVNVGNLATSINDIRISSNGKITLGQVSAQENLIVNSTQDIALTAKQFAKQKVNISGSSIYASDAAIIAGNELEVSASRDVKLKGSSLIAGVNASDNIQSEADLNINADQLFLSAASVISHQNLTGKIGLIIADDKSLMASKNLSLNNLESLINEGIIQASNSLNIHSNEKISSTTKLNGTGEIIAGYIKISNENVAINTIISSLTSTTIDVISELSIDEQAKLNTNLDLNLNADKLFLNGELYVGENLDINSKVLMSEGQFLAKNIDITSMSVEQRKGELNAEQSITIQAKDLMVNGLIQAGGILRVTNEDQLKNQLKGRLLAKDNVELNNKVIINQGVIQAGKNLIVSTDDFVNHHQVLANENIIISTQQLHQTGGMLANQALLLSVLNAFENLGEMQSGQHLSINAANANVKNSGLLSAGNSLSVDASQFTNTSEVMASGDIIVDAENITNTGGIYAQNGLSLQSRADIYNTGLVKSEENIVLLAQNLNQEGTIEAQQSLDVITDDFQQEGDILAVGDVTISARTAMQKGIVKSGGNVSLDVDHKVINDGVIQAGKVLNIHTKELNNNNKLESQNQLILSASSLYQLGEIASGGDIQMDISGYAEITNNITSNSNISLSVGSLNNQAKISSLGNTNVNVENSFTNSDDALISGSNTTIEALNIDNFGQLQALNNLGLSIENLINSGALVALNDLVVLADNDVTNYGVIYSGNNATFNMAGKLTNKQADIYIGYDLTIQGRNQDDRADSVDNISGNIESTNNLIIKSNQLTNRRIRMDVVTEKSIKNNIPDKIERDMTLQEILGSCYEVGSGHQGNSAQKCGFSFNGVNESLLVSTESVNVNSEGGSARLVSNANMRLEINDIRNDASIIVSNNNLSILANNIFNKSYQEYQHEIRAIYQTDGGVIYKVDRLFPNTTPVVAYRELQQSTNFGDKYQSSIIAAGIMTINVKDKVDNGTIGKGVKEQLLGVSASAQEISNVNKNESPILSQSNGINSPNINIPALSFPQRNNVAFPEFKLPKNQNGLFIYSPDPKAKYVIETNPALTNLGDFLGSEYFQSELGINFDDKAFFLGDAFYDTRIITQTIFERTGRRYLHGEIGNDLVQMQQLINSAALENVKLNLTAGIALTAEQVTSITHDIIWYETILLNGNEVLAPKLYLSEATIANVKNGALIGGNDIVITAGEITNSGTMDSLGNMTLVSQNTINNKSGLISSSGDMLLQALNDINNVGAKIKGGNVALISDQGSINNQTESSTIRLSDSRSSLYVGTQLSNTASIESNNDLVMNAGKDINIHASNVTTGGSAALQAGDNINITSANDTTQIKGHNMEKRHVEVVSSTVNAGNDLALNASQDITVIGSQLAAGGDAALKAKGDITLQAQTNSDYSYLKTKQKKSFGRSKTTIVETQTESVVGSDVTSGGNLTLQAQKLGDTQLAGGSSSINVIGSKLTSSGDISLSADDDITLATQETKTYSHKEVSKSGFGGMSKKQKGSIDYATQLTGSDVVGAGSVLINSGHDINLIASGIKAGKDASLTAMNQVLVGAGETTESHQSWSKSSSFLSGGSLFSMESIKDTSKDINAQGSNITAQGNVNVQSGNTKVIGSDIEAKGNILLVADTGDVQVLAAEESHNSTHKSEKLDVGFGDALKSLTPQGMIDSVKESTKNGQVKATIAEATYDAQESSIERTTHQGSNIVAGGDVTVNADNDINIEGSNLIAGNTQDSALAANGATYGANQSGDVNLSAGNNITITEVNDTEHTKSKETHGEASLSVTVQHQAVEVAKMVVATEKARKQAEQAQKDYKQYKKQLGGLEDTLSDLKTQLANHEPGVTKQDILELQGIIADTKDDEAWYVSSVALAGANLASKITLLAKQTAAAAQSSGTYGFDVGLEANVAANTSKNETISSTAQGSTIAGNSINIKAGQDATIQGSQVLADDELNLSADNINILASKDTQYTQSSSESGSITVSTSVYGASTGLSVNAEMSNNAATSNSTTYNNSVLVGDNVNIKSTNDTTIKGGNVIANNDLNVDVGGDLTVESVQNRETASNHGMSISAGTSFGGGASDSNWHAPISGETGGDLSGGSAGFNQSQGRSSNTDTVISSLVSNGDANINVKGNTDITGSTIATLDENGNDSGKLALNTGSLTFTDLSDTHYSSSNNNGVNTSVGINGTDIDATNNSSTINIHNGSSYSKDKTLATLGQGDITVNGQTETGDGTVLAPELNRDLNNQDKELFAVDRQQGNVDVTVDHRLLTEDGREQIAKELKESGQNTQIIANEVAVIPNIECGGECSAMESNYNAAVDILGVLGAPTENYNGGIIAQLPVLLGDKDIKFSITGDPNSKTYTINGVNNTFEGAQDGGDIMAGEGVAHQTVYNPTHGFMGDLFESAVDLFGNSAGIQTGVSKQVEQVQKDCTDCTIYMHSQGNIISQAGANPKDGNRYISIGSPLWSSTLKDKFNIDNKLFILKHDGDYVAKPINMFKPTTWNDAGHPVETYKPELDRVHEVVNGKK